MSAADSPSRPLFPVPPPDGKDWTWVLQRPCPDCGYAAADTDPRDVPRLVREQAALWPAVLARADARVRPADTVWSPVEYGCHVRDVLVLFAARVGLMLAEDEPVFANWDQDETAITSRYAVADPSVVAQEIVAAGEQAAVAFERVGSVGGEADWERRGIRSNGSEFTVATLATYFVHDLVHHAWDVGA